MVYGLNTAILGLMLTIVSGSASATGPGTGFPVSTAVPAGAVIARDSVLRDSAMRLVPADQQGPHTMWGIDILISNDGFGLGGSYSREFTPDIMGFATFSISESKDPREVEQIDIFGNTYTPGKLNRFLVLPLMFGIDYRLFREDIVDTFRPYVNVGAGPAMIYQMPYIDISGDTPDLVTINQVDFFKAIGRGRPHYTVSSFIGFGARFGAERAGSFGVNFRYYFTYLLSGSLPSLYNPNDPLGGATATKRDFGGFFITLNVALGY